MRTQRVNQRPVLVGSVTGIAMAASVIPVASYSVLAPFIIDSLDISRTSLGLLITSFQAAGAALSAVAGILVNRYGAGRLLMWLYAASATSIAVMVLPGTFVGLLVGALIAGAANAIANPTTNRLVAGALPEGSRGLAIGIKQSGTQFAFFAFGGLPLVAAAWGWRPALALAFILPSVGIVASLLSLDLESDPVARATHREIPSTTLPRAVWWITAFSLVLGLASGSVKAYVPLFAVESLDMSPVTAGLTASVLGAFGLVFRIAWASGAERFSHPSAPLAIISGMGALAGVLLLLAPEIGIGALWLGVVIAGMSFAAWNSVAMLAVISEVSLSDAGRASGIVLTGFFVGHTISPVAFGFSVDVTGGYGLGWTTVVSLAVVGLAVCLAWRRTVA